MAQDQVQLNHIQCSACDTMKCATKKFIVGDIHVTSIEL